jgi:hypothetical protein
MPLLLEKYELRVSGPPRFMGDLPKRHPYRGIQTPKKPGKTGLSAAIIGWEIRKLSVRENRGYRAGDASQET